MSERMKVVEKQWSEHIGDPVAWTHLRAPPHRINRDENDDIIKMCGCADN